MLDALPMLVGGDKGGSTQGSAKNIYSVLLLPYPLAVRVRGVYPLAAIRDVVDRKLRLRASWSVVQG